MDNNRNGFTLVEVMVVLIILALSFTVFLQALNTGKNVRVKSELRTVQSVLLNSIQNQIRSRRFDENSGPIWTNPGELGIDDGETILTQFDDIDDFHLYTQEEIDDYSGFSISVEVTYADEQQEFNLPDPNTATNFKRVSVTVSHGILPDVTDIMIISSGI